MADPAIGEVPPQEAIAFFRQKLSIPTERWDDMVGQAHAKAFTVAGAAKTELRQELREAIDKGISEGESLSSFRGRFDDIVQRHGWSYKGERGWRTGVIYSTNLRTAHMAGRWQQHQRRKGSRPFLQYLTAGDNRVRPEHAAWDEVILPIDHPWWDTHYPPNGWGCRCTIRSLSQRQLDRMDAEVSRAPARPTEERVNTRTGEVYGEVPIGIDTGWDYNVGKGWLGPDIALGESLVKLPATSRAPALAAATRITLGERDSIANWVRAVLSRDRALGEMRTVGWLDGDVIQHIQSRGIQVANAALMVEDSRLRRMVRHAKQARQAALTADDIALLPMHLADPQAVLWDTRSPALLYVFPLQDSAEKVGKFVVRVDFRRRGNNLNLVRSGGALDPLRLDGGDQYEVIKEK